MILDFSEHGTNISPTTKVGYSADLDAPTPGDISKEFWGYLDPDSPTPHELADEVVCLCCFCKNK
jgi:hypothetical protein